MSATIFCTFEQQDFADFAMGQLRKMRGVTSIHYAVKRKRQDKSDGFSNAVGAVGMANSYPGTAFGLSWGLLNERRKTAEAPSPPANVKIVCQDSVRKDVVALLVNLHAQKIVSV